MAHVVGVCDHPDCWACDCGKFWSHAMTADVMFEHEFYDCILTPLEERNAARLADGMEALSK